MDPNRRIFNLALAGFMGTGKSTVGHVVAAMLDFSFLDTDELIEKMAGKRITDIFASEGEERFRSYERDVVRELSNRKETVISTGGGLVVDPANLSSLREHALIVCLWASPETIYSRVRHQGHRPLLASPEPLERIRELLAARAPFYRKADVLVNSAFRTPREVAQHVAHEFKAVRQRSAAAT